MLDVVFHSQYSLEKREKFQNFRLINEAKNQKELYIDMYIRPYSLFLMQQTPRAIVVKCDGSVYDVDVDVVIGSNAGNTFSKFILLQAFKKRGQSLSY